MSQLLYTDPVRCCVDCRPLIERLQVQKVSVAGSKDKSDSSSSAAASSSKAPAAAASYDILAKMLLVGDSGVGQSSMTDNISSAKLFSYWRSLTLLQFADDIDTAGQERFRTITSAYYRGAMLIFIVYDVTDERSFNNVKMWMNHIDKEAASDVLRILVANKVDIHSERVVDPSRGEALAADYGIPFIECSAKSSVNVEDLYVMGAVQVAKKLTQESSFMRQLMHADGGATFQPFTADAIIMPSATFPNSKLTEASFVQLKITIGIDAIQFGIEPKKPFPTISDTIRLKIDQDVQSVYMHRCGPNIVCLTFSLKSNQTLHCILHLDVYARMSCCGLVSFATSSLLSSDPIPLRGEAASLARSVDRWCRSKSDASLVYQITARQMRGTNSRLAELGKEGDMLLNRINAVGGSSSSTDAGEFLSLHVADLPLMSEQLSCLAVTFQYNTSLTDLDLSNQSPITENFRLLMSSLRELPLIKLSLARCNLAALDFKELSCLSALSCNSLNLRKNGLAKFSDPSYIPVSVRELTLADNDFTDASAATIWPLISRVKVLDISGHAKLTQACIRELIPQIKASYRTETKKGYSYSLNNPMINPGFTSISLAQCGFTLTAPVISELKDCMHEVHEARWTESSAFAETRLRQWKNSFNEKNESDMASMRSKLPGKTMELHAEEREKCLAALQNAELGTVEGENGAAFKCKDALLACDNPEPLSVVTPDAIVVELQQPVAVMFSEAFSAYLKFLQVFLLPPDSAGSFNSSMMMLTSADKSKVWHYRRLHSISSAQHREAMETFHWTEQEWDIGEKLLNTFVSLQDMQATILRAMGEINENAFPSCMLLFPRNAEEDDDKKTKKEQKPDKSEIKKLFKKGIEALMHPESILHDTWQLHLLCEWQCDSSNASASTDGSASSPKSDSSQSLRWHRTHHPGYPIHSLKTELRPLAPYASASMKALKALGKLANIIKLPIPTPDLQSFCDSLEKLSGVHTAVKGDHFDQISNGASDSSRKLSYESLRVLRSLVESAELKAASNSISSGVPRVGHLYGSLCRRNGPHFQAGEYRWLCEDHHRLAHDWNENKIKTDEEMEKRSKKIDDEFGKQDTD